MDNLDYEILACLKENSRENATNIGNKVNLSTSAVIERIKKMEASGLIEQYTTLINQSALGRELMAFIYVSLEHPKYYDGFVESINKNDAIAECYYIAGDYDFILKVVTKTGATLEEILKYIKYVNGVSGTRTSVVLSTNKRDVCMLPEREQK